MAEEAEAALITQLRRLGGVAEPVSDFVVETQGVRVRVEYTTGSSSSVTLSTPYDHAARYIGSQTQLYRNAPAQRLRATRPMLVLVSPETHVNKQGKESGLDVEHQTGDPRFDDVAYIDAPNADPLPYLFANEAVRLAILELFSYEFRAIRLDDVKGQITAYTSQFPSLDSKTRAPGQDVMNAFVRLATGCPPIHASGEAHEADPLHKPSLWLGGVGGILFLIATPIYFVGAGSRCPSDDDNEMVWQCIWPGLTGLAIGLVTASIFAFLAHTLVKGQLKRTSSTSSRISGFVVAFFLFTFNVISLSSALILAHLL